MLKIGSKGKIFALSNTEKVLWLRLAPTNNSVKYINNILKKYDPFGKGLEDIDECSGKKFSTKYAIWKNREFNFFSDNECVYIFFMVDKIVVILRKDSKLFNDLKKDFLNHFELKKK